MNVTNCMVKVGEIQMADFGEIIDEAEIKLNLK